MKVIAVSGSHRKGKNTSIMLKTVLDEVAKDNVETELIELVDYDIKLCTSCNKCMKNTSCSITGDDMDLLATKLQEADAIILGSPVYWANVSTLMKNFMDRTRFMHLNKNMLQGKVGAALTHAALRNGGQELCLSIMENYLKSQGLIVADCRDPERGIIANGAMGTLQQDYNVEGFAWKKGVEEDLVALEACRQLGKNILKLIRSK
ncbi:flavodoxin family protein [Zhaonella formicivorans]|uniref:flavodoxin family protein n=1 Tax=Zhaonella formicivorans TaxID=2528593 RepID=UPI0010D9695C|nr:flavodoxin family protein [Zhaonella formicivorans]